MSKHAQVADRLTRALRGEPDLAFRVQQELRSMQFYTSWYAPSETVRYLLDHATGRRLFEVRCYATLGTVVHDFTRYPPVEKWPEAFDSMMEAGAKVEHALRGQGWLPAPDISRERVYPFVGPWVSPDNIGWVRLEQGTDRWAARAHLDQGFFFGTTFGWDGHPGHHSGSLRTMDDARADVDKILVGRALLAPENAYTHP